MRRISPCELYLLSSAELIWPDQMRSRQRPSLNVRVFCSEKATLKCLPNSADLVELDEVKATALLVHHQDEIPPAAVVASLQVPASWAGAHVACEGRPAACMHWCSLRSMHAR